MKKYLLSLVVLVSLTAHAQIRMSKEATVIFCAGTEEMYSALTSMFGEKPVWQGKDDQTGGNAILWQNKEKETYTYTVTVDNKTCVYSVGTAKGA